jgi:Tfp pilus assembly protein PilO
MNKIVLARFEITKKLGYVALALAVALLFFVDYFFIIRFQAKAVTSLGRKVSGLAKDIKETQSHFKNMDQLKAETAMLQEKLGKIEKSILPTADMTMIADYLHELAAKHSIQISQISPVGESEAKAFKNDHGEYLGLPISLEAEGGYHNIGSLFSSIENGEICMNIQSFQIAQNPRNTKKHVLKMLVIVFILKKGSS